MVLKDEILKYINLNHVLRYLNYKGQVPDQQTLDLVKMVMNETISLSSFKYHKQTFQMKVEMQHVLFHTEPMKAHDVISSVDLSIFLDGCDELNVVGMTLGFDLSRKIHQYMLTEPTKGVIMDACASVLADAYCDFIQDEITAHQNRLGRYTSQRFSPGYGDLGLGYQNVFANYLNLSKRIGVHLTSHNQLNPEKSVIFVMGTSSKPISSKTRTCETDCQNCKLRWCQFRREINE